MCLRGKRTIKTFFSQLTFGEVAFAAAMASQKDESENSLQESEKKPQLTNKLTFVTHVFWKFTEAVCQEPPWDNYKLQH